MNSINHIRKIKVLLADDHTIVRQGLCALLEATPDIEVVAEAADGRMAVKLAKELQPDVVVIDVMMPLLNGLEATRQILRDAPKARVLVLSSYHDDEKIAQLIEHGATGYLLKQNASNDLVKAIHEARKGNSFFSPGITRKLLDRCRNSFFNAQAAEKDAHELTSRETEVLQLVAEGYANKQMADVLSISIKTVEKHRQQLMDKLKIHEAAGLTRYAAARRIIEVIPPQPAALPAPC
jgi:DNA-binding NarL/FixJ family response regulator